MITPIKTQKELIEDKTSPIIIFAGGYGSGKNTALALKSLSSNVSLNIDLDYNMIHNVNFPIFNEILDKIYQVKISKYNCISTKFSTVYFNWYDKYNFLDIIKIRKYDTICLNNFELLDNEIALKTLKIAKINAKQVIISVFPYDVKPDSFILDLIKTEKVITASTYNNPFIPESFTDDIKKDYSLKDSNVKILEGKFN